MMRIGKTVTAGLISGLAMGMCLFIGGAILSRIFYGPQFVPEGKFEPEQVNAFFFFWTKIAIGLFFGLLFAFAHELLPLRNKITGAFKGLQYGFIYWLLFALWQFSHPLIYGPLNLNDNTFWVLYQLCGFLGLGASIGSIYKRRAKKETAAIAESR